MLKMLRELDFERVMRDKCIHMLMQEKEMDLPTTPDDLFGLFEELGISYELFHHVAVFTVEESEKVDAEIPTTHCRNLFVRTKKKDMFLVVLANETQLPLKDMEERIGCKRLSFGSADRLWNTLGIRAGSVCPFTVVNDTEKSVTVILDKYMMEQETVGYHPLDNTMTVVLTPEDLMKFFKHTGHEPKIIDFS